MKPKSKILIIAGSDSSGGAGIQADIKTVSGAISFHQACRANDVKPILGCDYEGYLLIAKNKEVP